MGKKYNPELGQAAFGNPNGEFGLPEFAEALLDYIFEEIGRRFWNKHQKEWSDAFDPEIPGIEVRPYWWGAKDSPQAAKPNFKFGDVKIWWYKYRGRGMSCNVTLPPDAWVGWFERCLKTIRENRKEP